MKKLTEEEKEERYDELFDNFMRNLTDDKSDINNTQIGAKNVNTEILIERAKRIIYNDECASLKQIDYITYRALNKPLTKWTLQGIKQLIYKMGGYHWETMNLLKKSKFTKIMEIIDKYNSFEEYDNIKEFHSNLAGDDELPV